MITPKQLKMLRSYGRDGEASDIDEFDSPLGWRNRQRVIDSLRRKGLLDDDGGVTEKGRAWL